MPFYLEKDDENDFEIENKYSIKKEESLKKTEEKSDNFSLVQNEERKTNSQEDKIGINKEELRKRIADFSLDKKPKKKKDFVVNKNSRSEENFVEEDEEGVPRIRDSKIQQIVNSRKKSIKNKISTNQPLVKRSQKNKKSKAKTGETLLWYIKISRWPSFFIVLYSVLILVREYLVSISSNLTDIAQKIYWIDDFKWIFEVLVFIIVSYIVIKKRKQLPRIAGIAGSIIGFSAGVIIAVIKLFWYREMWNIFYLSAESIFLAIIGLVVCLVTGALFYEEF